MAHEGLYKGGRFDATSEDSFSYLYAALSETTALAETLVRAVGFPNGRSARTILRRKLDGLRLSALQTTADLRLIRLLSTPDLAAVAQDDWLLHCETQHYPWTRDWLRWLRTKTAWPHGVVWLSKRDLPQLCVLIFGDRLPVAKDEPILQEIPSAGIDLDSEPGIDWLNSTLEPYRVKAFRKTEVTKWQPTSTTGIAS